MIYGEWVDCKIGQYGYVHQHTHITSSYFFNEQMHEMKVKTIHTVTCDDKGNVLHEEYGDSVYTEPRDKARGNMYFFIAFDRFFNY